MSTYIVPLGTASAVPTRDRHPSATALFHQGRLLLFDCGEGTQIRLVAAGLRPTRIEAIFITHLHGDHYFGLMGLVSTLSMLGRRAPLTVVSPAGLAPLFDVMPGIEPERLTFPLEFVQLPDGFRQAIVYESDSFVVEARPLEHRTPTAGFRFQERPRPGNLDVERARALGVSDYTQYRRLKAGESVTLEDGRVVRPEDVVGPEKEGASFAYVTDTRPCEGGKILSRQADLLYHDATFTREHQARAEETGHSTAGEAAEIARQAGARRLLIGHISARHSDPAGLLAEARAVFKNTEVAEELKRYALREPLPTPEQ